MEPLHTPIAPSIARTNAAGSSLDRAGTSTATGTPQHIHYTHTRVLPVAPDTLRQHHVIAGQPPSPYVDAYKILRTRILQKMRERNWNALAITSPHPQAGKTLAAINLALSLALEINQTVLLVDANLRDPAVHRYFGFTPEVGLSDYLLDHLPVEQLLINPQGIERFVMLPGSRPLPDSSEMLSSPRMVELVEELKQRYPSRLVLFDLPHLATSDTLAFAPYVDAVLLIVEQGVTTQDQLKHAMEHLHNTPLIGTVINKTESA